MGKQDIWHHQQLIDDMDRIQVYRENQLGTLPRPPELKALFAVMLDNEEELDAILEELPGLDLARLLISCERLSSKCWKRLHGTPQG